jgi:hypothetical protein
MSFLEELRLKQADIMSKVVDRGAQALQGRLVAETKKVAATIKGAVVLVPPTGAKGRVRATKKVNEEYGGDWLEIKDMARCTLVVELPMLIDTAIKAVRAHFRASNGFTVFEEKVTVGALNAAGYSGTTVFVSSGGNKGEIQINTPALMYAKSLHEFRDALPHLEAKMKATYPLVPGGLGHDLYVAHRDKTKTEDVRRRYGNASKLYYNYFRSFPPNMNWGMMARDAVLPLI